MFSDLVSESLICDACYRALEVTFKVEKLSDVEVLSLYEYNEKLQTLLYNLKALGDIELADVFLNRHLPFLKAKYHGYVIIPAPSSIEDDKKRGFNHVVKIFKSLNFEILPLITKKIAFKQSDLNFKARQEVLNKLVITNGAVLRKRKVLIVDDVKTTGATLKAMITLIKPFKPKVMKVLTISATKQKT